ELGPGDRAGARGRQRDRTQSRDHGCDGPEEGCRRHHSRGPGREHRGQRRTRLGRCRDRDARDCVFLRHIGHLPPRMNDGRVNLLGLTRGDLEAFCATLGSKPFRARQLMNWLYKRGCDRFEDMSDLARDFRAVLVERAQLCLPQILTKQQAADGTCKWLLCGGNGQAFEMVYIPETDRGTLCISSQVGCALDCSFCSTAQQGFNRNLTTAEIVGQVWLANRELEGSFAHDSARERIITNVVLMGMGEPLANFRNVVPALEIFLDDFGFDLSRRRVTLSTSGLVPQIYKLAEHSNVA